SVYCEHGEDKRLLKLSDYLCDECGSPEVVDRPVPELAPLQLLQHVPEGALIHGHATAGGDAVQGHTGQGLRICKRIAMYFHAGYKGYSVVQTNRRNIVITSRVPGVARSSVVFKYLFTPTFIC
ncbi:hypothetical protein AVEN_80969-1, partial [Araneus ventricosus]